jgi:zinc protease
MSLRRLYLWPLLFGLVAATPPAWAGLKIESWTSVGGARVYFVESHALPIIDVQIDFGAGSAHEPADKAGLAGLVGGMLESGTDTLDENQIADRQADLGVQFGGGADSDRASVNLRSLSSPAQFRPALDLLIDVVSRPEFPEPVFQRERGRLIAGLKEAETQPASIAGRKFSAAIYGTHPYGPSATPETVARIERADLAQFYRRYYVAANASLAIVGDLSRAQAEALATELLGSIPVGEPAPALAAPALPAGSTERVAHPSAQAHVLMGLPVLTRDDPDYYPLLVGNYVLGGGGFVSRLTAEVREKRGYAYSVYSAFSPDRVAGPFQIGLQTKGSQIDDALSVVRSTLRDFIAGGPTGQELAAAKANIINGFGLRLDSNRKILGYVSMMAFYGLPPDWLDAYPKAVAAVTETQIKDAFQRRVPMDLLVTVVVGGNGDRAPETSN